MHSQEVLPSYKCNCSRVIAGYLKNKKVFGKLYIGKNGILGALKEELIDVNNENTKELDH